MNPQTSKISAIYKSRQMQSPITQSILMLLVIALFGWFILQPKFAATKEQRVKLDAFEAQQASLEQDKEELDKLISKLKSSPDEVKLLDEAIPLHTRSTEVSVLIEGYARSSGMTVNQLNVEGLDKTISAGNKKVLEDPYAHDRQLVVADSQVIVGGNIDQFRNFLQLLETSGRLADIVNMEVSSAEEGLVFSLRIRTYAYMVSDAKKVETKVETE